jgi:hypothetical protein
VAHGPAVRKWPGPEEGADALDDLRLIHGCTSTAGLEKRIGYFRCVDGFPVRRAAFGARVNSRATARLQASQPSDTSLASHTPHCGP